MIRTLFPLEKKALEDSFKDCGEESKTWEEIQQRARELGI